MDSLLHDIRYAFRSLLRSRGLVLVCILTLALGIGVNTAMFSVVDAVLLEEPPYEDPDGLVILWNRHLSISSERYRVPAPDVAEYAQAPSLSQVAFTNGPIDVVLEGGGAPQHVRVGVVTPNLFSVLGVQAVLGRTFVRGEAVLPAEDLRNDDFAPPPSAILLSHELWRSRFGGDAGVLGRTVRLSGASMTVVGVLPSDFRLMLPPNMGIPAEADAWTPLRLPLSEFRRPEGLRDQDSDNTGAVIARLASGADLDRARQEVSAIAARLRGQVASYAQTELRAEVEPLQRDAVSHARPTLVALMGAVLLVLLIACINVANLLLARASDQRMEMAIRSALGARRSRIARQVLTESALLALLGAGLGIFLAVWLIEGLMRLGPEVARIAQAGLDWTVLLFAIAATAFSVFAFGAAPALSSAREGSQAVRGGGARGGQSGRIRLRTALVVAEVGLSFALLVGAGLLLKTSAGLQQVSTGFDADGLLTLRMNLPGRSVGGPGARAALLDDFEGRIRDLPGVQAVGLIGGLPLAGTVFRQPYGLEGDSIGDWSGREANFRVVSAEYFRAMGTRLLAGRFFTQEENLSEEQRVVIIDAKLAGRFGQGQAVGQTIGFPLDGDPIRATVVGVVENVRFEGLRDEGPETIYVPYRQEASRSVSFAVRTFGPPLALVGPIEALAGRLGADVPVPVYGFRSMQEYVARTMASTRFAVALIGLFAVVALGLAVVGLAGLISYSVRGRTREIGVRLALGADSGRIQRDVLYRGAWMGLLGVGLGLLLSAAASWLLSSLLFQVDRLDPMTHILVALLLLAVALLASWWPARRAATVEPVEALRYE